MTRRLLIDAGNTRIKWCCKEGHSHVSSGAFGHGGAEATGLAELPVASVDSIWVCNVAGAKVEDALRDWARNEAQPTPEFVAVERESLGLRVAYSRLSRLGVDRYLAMLGGRASQQGALCVVDIGTAMTLDAVDGRGMHQGGLIAPGPQTMMQALLEGTAQIGDVSEQPPVAPFARDTAEAVTGGACYAAAALVDRFVRATSSLLDTPVTLLVAGGGRGLVWPLLETAGIEAPDLVFDGLLALARRREGTNGRPNCAKKDETSL